MAKKIHLISLASGVFSNGKESLLTYQKRLRLLACDYAILELPVTEFQNQHIQLNKKISQISGAQAKKVILLTEHGTQYSTQGFSEFVKFYVDRSIMLIFVIGTHQGFNQETLSLYKDTLSLSPMTFPHQIVPLLFFEQLYRVETIIENKPYHY